MKKILALFLAAVLVMSISALSVAAEESTNVGKLSEELQKTIEETDDPDALIEVIAYGSYGLSLDKKTKLELLDTPGEHGFSTKLQEMVVQYYRENNTKLFEEIQTVSPKAVQIKKAGSYCFVSNETKVAEEPNEYGLYDVLLFKSVTYRGEKELVRLGDVDNDGDLTVFDATGIQRELVGIGSTEYIEDCADYDHDGDVSVLDATAIQRKLADL